MIPIRLLFGLTAVAFAGCISSISARKVLPGQNPKGMRVMLPAPFVVGRPNPAGEITWTIEYLPDPDEEYAVHAWSIMAKNTTKLNRTESGMLKGVEFDMDTASVAEQFLKSAKEVAPEAVKAIKAQDDAAEAARQNVAQAKAAAREQAEAKAQEKVAALEKAKVAVEAARAEFNVKEKLVGSARQAVNDAKTALAANADPSKVAGLQAAITAAEKAQIEAEGARETANLAFKQALKAEQDARTDFNKAVEAAFDTGLRAQSGGGNPAVLENQKVKVPGPVVFRIVEDPCGFGLRLEPVSMKLFSMNGKRLTMTKGKQLSYGTWGKKPEPKKDK